MNKANISKIIKVLKDDYRSYVCVFKVDGDNKEYVYKEPRKKYKKMAKIFKFF